MSTGRLELSVDGLRACLQHSRGDQHQRLFGIYRWGWGFSTLLNFNGDIA